MPDSETLARVNRQMVAERADLLAQLAATQQELRQRHVDTATAAIRGLESLVELAEQGNPAAKLALRTLDGALERVRALSAGLVVVRH